VGAHPFDFRVFTHLTLNEMKKTPKPLSFSIASQTFDLMARYLLLGFELDLYSDTESGMVAFYLGHIYKSHLELLQVRIEMQSSNHNLDVSRLSIREESADGSDSDNNTALDALYQHVQAHLSFCTGLFHLTLYLEKMKKISRPTNPFYSFKLHFEHRFKVLGRTQSLARLEFEEFERARETGLGVSSFLISHIGVDLLI
jgi:hypothetical protein